METIFCYTGARLWRSGCSRHTVIMDASLQSSWWDGDRGGICPTAQNLLLPDWPGPQDFIFLINKRENPAYLWGEYLEYQLQCRTGFFVWKIRFFLIRYICLICSCSCANSLFELRHAPAFAGNMYLITEKSRISYQTRKPVQHCSWYPRNFVSYKYAGFSAYIGRRIKRGI